MPARVRPLVYLLLVVLILALLGWGLDWGARVAAQSLVARSVQDAQHLRQRPEVTVQGWFFLPQLVSGDYDEVEVTVHDLRTGPLPLDTVFAHLYGVHVPVHDVVTGAVSAVPVERTIEIVTLAYSDLDRYLAAHGHSLSLAAGPPGEVEITAHVSLFGQSLAVSADARVRSVPGYLEITPTSLDTGAEWLDSATRLLLGRRLTVRIPLEPLPFGQRVTAIHPGQAGLIVHAAGHNVVLDGKASSGLAMQCREQATGRTGVCRR